MIVVVVLPASAAPGASPLKESQSVATMTCGPKPAAVKDLSDRGIDHAKHGRFAEAEQCFLLARERSPVSRQWTNLGSLYLDWANALASAGKDDEARRRWGQSSAAFEGAFKAAAGPPPAQTHNLLAGTYYHTGQKDKAIAHLGKLLLRSDAQPADRERAHKMLDAFLRKPQVELSEKAWAEHDEMFQKGSGLVSPYMVLAGNAAKPTTPAKLPDLTKGLDLLKRVVGLNPRNWAAYWIMGKAHEARGEPRAAYDAFKRAGEIHPYHPDVAREECLALLNLGRISEGLATAQRATKYNPEDPGLQANLALAQLLSGDLATAETNATNAQAAAPDDAVTRNLLKVIVETKAGRRQRPKKLPIPVLD